MSPVKVESMNDSTWNETEQALLKGQLSYYHMDNWDSISTRFLHRYIDEHWDFNKLSRHPSVTVEY